MQEKRKHKRVVMETNITAKEISVNNYGNNEPLNIDIFDISMGGIGFHADRLLALDSFYDAKIKLLNGETFSTLIKVVRGFGSDTYTYGAEFVNLSPADAYRIELYILVLENCPEYNG